MDKITLSYFRDAISDHRETLIDWLNSDESTKNMRLGNASVKDVLEVVSDLKETLQKIEAGTYATCEVCQGEVETEQLEMNCTASICLDCYSEDQLRSLERDLELAAKVQKQLLPGCVPSLPGVDIAAKSEPAQIVGGDYYDFFECRSGHQGFVLGDVMGKGLPASMLMSNLQASLRILGPEYDELHTLARRLNLLFRYNTKLIRFISLFMAILDLEKSVLNYCNAGHHPPLLYRSGTKNMVLLNPTSPAIGLTADQIFTSQQITIGPGDVLVLYTDGLTEARNQQQEEYGEDRVAGYLKNHHDLSAGELLNGLLDDVKQFALKIDDDLTVLIIKMLY